ncbi:MAG: DUF1501 domain-containing protein [Planctomycetota bacterium]|nr:DUF1501 domain-containing protein [Planctomycetota bacterium]
MNRRTLLKGGALAGAALVGATANATASAFASPLLRPALGLPERKTKRVILVAFAGGVRTRETLGTPQNVPNLAQMAKEGITYTRARTSNLGHFGAALSLLTGISEARGIRENARGPDPTVFEYVRKEGGLSGGEVWMSTSGGAQQANYGYSTHPDYGPRYGANTLDGDGIFNQEFKDVIARYGRPKELGKREGDVLERMRRSIESKVSDESVNDAETARRVEKYILDELARGTADLRGVNSGDAKALQVARNLMLIFKPRLLGVTLQNADVAHGNYNAYVEVIRRNDEGLGALWQVVKNDYELRESTAIFVVPEFGRNRDLNARRGLDHGDGSDDLNYVTCVAWGPDFKKGKIVKNDVRTIDVCPTVCDLLGADARLARGKKLPGLFG